MELTNRQKFVLWLHKGPKGSLKNKLYIALADRHNKKLAKTEYDKQPDAEGYVDRMRSGIQPPQIIESKTFTIPVPQTLVDHFRSTVTINPVAKVDEDDPTTPIKGRKLPTVAEQKASGREKLIKSLPDESLTL